MAVTTQTHPTRGHQYQCPAPHSPLHLSIPIQRSPLLGSNLQAGTLVATRVPVSGGSGMDRWTGPESCTSVPFPVKRWTLRAATGTSSSQVALAAGMDAGDGAGERMRHQGSPLPPGHPVPLPLCSVPRKAGKLRRSRGAVAAVSDAQSWLYVELRGRRAARLWNCTHGWPRAPAGTRRGDGQVMSPTHTQHNQM